MQKSIPLPKRNFLQFVRDAFTQNKKQAVVSKTKTILDELPNSETVKGNILTRLHYSIILKNIGLWKQVNEHGKGDVLGIPAEVKELRFSNAIINAEYDHLHKEISELEADIIQAVLQYKENKALYQAYIKPVPSQHELKMKAKELERIENIETIKNHPLNLRTYRLISIQEKTYNGEGLGRDLVEWQNSNLDDLEVEEKEENQIQMSWIEYLKDQDVPTFEIPYYLNEKDQELFQRSAKNSFKALMENDNILDITSIKNLLS